MPNNPNSNTTENMLDKERWLALTLSDHTPNSKLLQPGSSACFVLFPPGDRMQVVRMTGKLKTRCRENCGTILP